MAAAYWVDEERLTQLTGKTIAELICEDVLNLWTPDNTERNLLALIRCGNKTQQERAFAQFRKLYPTKD